MDFQSLLMTNNVLVFEIRRKCVNDTLIRYFVTRTNIDFSEFATLPNQGSKTKIAKIACTHLEDSQCPSTIVRECLYFERRKMATSKVYFS
jgi:hypothetical protein